MQHHPFTRAARRPSGWARRAVAAIVAAATLAGGTALAASTIDASSFATQSGTVWQFLRANAARRPAAACFNGSSQPTESFTCLQKALSTAGLDEVLRQDGDITLFAPTDAGFEALQRQMGAGPFNVLMSDEKRLHAVLQGLMVRGRYTSADLLARAVPATGRLTLPTLAGNELELTFDRFPSASGRVKVSVGRETFLPGWTPYLSGETTLLNNGAVIPMDMVYLPPALR